jgi:membrane-bound serine protease (ClpP class)
MSLKQIVVNVLADPNVAVLLGLAAMIGIGIELYHPGAVLPGVLGAICLVLSLTSAQVLPISYGGVSLLVLGVLFFGVEIFVPSFGIWGVAGIVCFVLGSIYFIDDQMVWSGKGFGVNPYLVGGVAAIGGLAMMALVTVAVRVKNRKVATGREGMIGERGRVIEAFAMDNSQLVGRVEAMGSIWSARASSNTATGYQPGLQIVVKAIEPGMVLVVEATESSD